MKQALFSMLRSDPARASAATPASFLYLLAAAIWICPILFMGILGYQILLTVVWAAALYVIVLRCAREGNAELSVVGLMPLMMHMLIFGIGGIFAMLVEDNDRFKVLRFNFNDDAIVYVSIISAFAGFVFWIFYNMNIRHTSNNSTMYGFRKEWALIAIVMLAVDMYARFVLIRSGSYLAWADGAAVSDEVYRRTGTLPKVQAALWPLLLSCVAGLLFTSQKPAERNVWRVVIGFLLIAIIGQGSRMMIIMSILVIVLAKSASVYGNVIMSSLMETKKLIMYSLLIAFFLGILSPVVQEARYMARYNAANGREVNTIDYVTEYIPASLSWSRLYGSESARFGRGVTLYGRIGSYSAYASAIVSKMDEGFPFMSVEDFNSAMNLIIPKYFLEARVSFDADRAIMRHYVIGNENMDAGSTYVIDIYSYKNIIGIFLLFAFAGYVSGWIVKFLNNRMMHVGLFLSIGLVIRLIPIGNSFAQFVASIRNNILLCLALFVLFKIANFVLSGKRAYA